MKRIVSFMMLLLVFNIQIAFGEDVWVNETWVHMERTIDCDGLPMLFDAEILQVPYGTTAREYHTERLSNDFAQKKVSDIDWLAFDCDLEGGKWIKDSGYYYTNIDKDCFVGIQTFCELGVHNRGVINESPYSYIAAETIYELDQRPLGDLTWDDAIKRAAQAANALGIQLGQPKYMQRCDDFIAQAREHFGSYFDDIWQQSFPDLTPEEADGIKTIEIHFPVYYQGLRLYSGETFGLQGETFIPMMNFDLQLHKSGQILTLRCPFYDKWTASSEDAPVLSIEEAVDCLQAVYADMYLPGVTCIRVHEAALEYTAITGDQYANQGFSIYPAWVFRITMELDSGEQLMEYVGFHALTGKQLF